MQINIYNSIFIVTKDLFQLVPSTLVKVTLVFKVPSSNAKKNRFKKYRACPPDSSLRVPLDMS